MTEITGVIKDFETWLESIGVFGDIIRFVISAAWAILVVSIIFRIGRVVFNKRLKAKDRIQVRFVENILRIGVVLVAIFWVFNNSGSTDNFGKVLFQGTAIIGAIIGLAAQPVISDLCCGIMITICKPFEIGDRVELENGIAGIVRDITIRHVVIRGMGTSDIIIPNSVINSMAVTNLSHDTGIRSLYMKFNISYGSDVEAAESLIKKANIDSPFTIPAHPGGDGIEYCPVYFMEYSDSSLVLATTVYYGPETPIGEVKNDINLRVRKAFAANGVEIPFNYLNVVMHEKE